MADIDDREKAWCRCSNCCCALLVFGLVIVTTFIYFCAYPYHGLDFSINTEIRSLRFRATFTGDEFEGRSRKPYDSPMIRVDLVDADLETGERVKALVCYRNPAEWKNTEYRGVRLDIWRRLIPPLRLCPGSRWSGTHGLVVASKIPHHSTFPNDGVTHIIHDASSKPLPWIANEFWALFLCFAFWCLGCLYGAWLFVTWVKTDTKQNVTSVLKPFIVFFSAICVAAFIACLFVLIPLREDWRKVPCTFNTQYRAVRGLYPANTWNLFFPDQDTPIVGVQWVRHKRSFLGLARRWENANVHKPGGFWDEGRPPLGMYDYVPNHAEYDAVVRYYKSSKHTCWATHTHSQWLVSDGFAVQHYDYHVRVFLTLILLPFAIASMLVAVVILKSGRQEVQCASRVCLPLSNACLSLARRAGGEQPTEGVLPVAT